MRTRKRDDDSTLLLACVGIIAGTAALYVWLLSSWLSAPSTAAAAAGPVPAAPAPRLVGPLEPARRALREAYLDPRAWLALSDALAKAGRPVDAFYVVHGAREFFGDDRFLAAHARALETARPVPPVETTPAELDSALSRHPEDRRLLLARARLTPDPMTAIPLYARAAHADTAAPEAKEALEQLQRLASASEDGPRGESSRLAREALEELRKAHPGDAAIFAALASAMMARGDRTTAQALVVEAGRKRRTAVVALVEGQLALEARDTDLALARFTEAWEADPDDLRSAEKLAAIYAEQRGDDEAALPYQIALYRRDPRRLRGVEPLEQSIRRTLDARRQAVLRNATVEGLGRYLRSEDASLRAEACARAAQFKDPRWIDHLAEMLDDDTEIVRRNADYALYQLARAAPDAVRARREDWLRDDRPLVRARALNLAADLWPNETLPAAMRALEDPSPAARYLAKTLVFDRYYRAIAAAQRAAQQYAAREKDPMALALLRAPAAAPAQAKK